MSIKLFLSSIFLFLSTAFYLESLKIISIPFKLNLPSPWGGTWSTSVGALLRSSTIVFLYDIVRSPLGLLLPIGLITFSTYRLLKSPSKPIIESIIIMGLAIILLIMKYNLIGVRYIGQAFWPLIIIFAILILISIRNNQSNS